MKLDYKYLCEDTDYSDSRSVFYYQYNSDCDNFEFSILLDDDLCLWNETQSITYKPKVGAEEFWDNPEFLVFLLDFENEITFKRKVIIEKVSSIHGQRNNCDSLGHSYNNVVIDTKLKIGEYKYKNLINLLKQVRKKGWI